MTKKEEFLRIQSYEEFDKKRKRFKGLKIDKDIAEHMDKIFPKLTPCEDGIVFDPPFPLKKKEQK